MGSPNVQETTTLYSSLEESRTSYSHSPPQLIDAIVTAFRRRSGKVVPPHIIWNDLPTAVRAAFPYNDDPKRIAVFTALLKHIATVPSLRSNFRSKVVDVDAEICDISAPTKPLRSAQPNLAHSFNGFPKQNVETRFAWVGPDADNVVTNNRVGVAQSNPVKREPPPSSDSFVDILASSPSRAEASPSFVGSSVSVYPLIQVAVKRGNYDIPMSRTFGVVSNASFRSGSPMPIPELEPFPLDGLRVPQELIPALTPSVGPVNPISRPHLQQFVHSPSSLPKQRVSAIAPPKPAAVPTSAAVTPKRSRGRKNKRGSVIAHLTSKGAFAQSPERVDWTILTGKDLRSSVLEIMKMNVGKSLSYQDIWDHLPPALASTYHPSYSPARRLHRFAMMVRGVARANVSHVRRIKGGELGRGKVGWMWMDKVTESLLPKKRNVRADQIPSDEDDELDESEEDEEAAPPFRNLRSKSKRNSFAESDSDGDALLERPWKRASVSTSPTASRGRFHSLNGSQFSNTSPILEDAGDIAPSSDDDDEEGSWPVDEVELAERWRRRRESILEDGPRPTDKMVDEAYGSNPQHIAGAPLTAVYSHSPNLPPLPPTFNRSYTIPTSPKRGPRIFDPADERPTMSPMSMVAQTLVNLRNAQVPQDGVSSPVLRSASPDDLMQLDEACDSVTEEIESQVFRRISGSGGEQIAGNIDVFEEITFSIPKLTAVSDAKLNGLSITPKSDSDATCAPSSPTMSSLDSFKAPNNPNINVAIWSYSERIRSWEDEGRKLEEEGKRLMNWKAKVLME
ncbi:hypothetical protein M427DRAFT_155386 [Gonapodya prolifera JEL478]|uniref:Uncharacterized protein n=1 Tax=Gonapodya prolifera (strain JEL478) TaxID=1344416 RepID=A0A139AGA2_GONPJ|nr:hypothetical protein M427DRAFT_155386 [Gonapodya prolifera JEL478]|eukprot:KXS15465.1 hypothetical protein M427DRAFT_155386 [Gonapodya prolifera JEL478]